MVDIRPYELNAKKHPQSQLKALAAIVAEVGWRQPVLVNQEGVIVAGHGRWLTWNEYRDEYHLPEIWVMDDKGNTVRGGPATTPFTKAQEEAYRLADNKLNESEWDMKLVIMTLKELEVPMINLTGFSPDLILEDDEKDDALPGMPEEAQSKLGDLYEIDGHRILVGDSTNKEHVKKLMEDRTCPHCGGVH